MVQYIVKIRSVVPVTHDVLGIVTEKPKEYVFTPGQATEVCIHKTGWLDQKRPFTFTSLPSDPQLEFTIKTYPSHHGVTNEFLSLKKGDELILHDVWGAISYKGEGVFIAGGAGITPFLSILRDLHSRGEVGNNRLIFANKTRKDIIHEEELRKILGPAFINILSDEEAAGYEHGFISPSFLEKHAAPFDRKFYVCGPPPMMDAVQSQLSKLGVVENSVVVEI